MKQKNKEMCKRTVIVFLYLICIHHVFSQAVKKPVELPITLKCNLEEMWEGDSLRIVAKMNKFGFDGIYNFSDINVDKHLLTLNLGTISQPAYLQVRVDTIRISGNRMMLMTQSFLVEPGDTIYLQKKGSAISISGGSTNFKYLQEVSQIGMSLNNSRWNGNSRLRPTLKDYSYLDSVTSVQLAYLESIKNIISTTSYSITKVNLLSGNQIQKRIAEKLLSNAGNRFKLPVEVIASTNQEFPDYKAIKRSLLGYNDRIESQLLKFVADHPIYLPYSISYSGFLYQKYLIDSCIGLNQNYDFVRNYNYLKTHYKGLLREKLIAQIVARNLRETVDLGYVIGDVLKYCEDIEFKKYFLSLQTGTNGKMAYKFELPDFNGNSIKLDSLKGKVVVLDLWFTGCVNCVAIHPIFESVVNHFSNNPNVIFVSINVDRERKTWVKSVLSGDRIGRYTSVGKHNLLNLYTDGQGDEHPMISYHIVKGYPTLIVVNPKGFIEQTPIDLRKDNGVSLIRQIKDVLARGEVVKSN